jgi:membrane-associated protease RseP (regulator of RpoE activity)
MMFALGVTLFALAILVSVALHECGHMWVARATGKKVRRYFVGFGPTLWSTFRPNKLGQTEYGIKAIPLGGFCDIAGMTAVEELAPEDRRYAMYRQKTWKRVAVLFAGPAMNFIIGLVLIYGIAVIWGLPNLNPPTAAIVGQTACVAPEVARGELGECSGEGPAALAGIQAGDTVVKVGDTPVANFDEMVTAVRELTAPTTFEIERDVDGQTTLFDTVVGVTQTQRITTGTDGAEQTIDVGAIGVSAAMFGPTHHNPLSAIPATFAFTGDLAVELGKALAKIPTKVGALVDAIGGAERDPETPISVVGASIIGGDTVANEVWVAFWFFLAQLNFVLGAINLVPLLPFDGGHIAVAVYERVRTRKGRRHMADVSRLLPLTYAVVLLLGLLMVSSVYLDIVDPIGIR